MSHFDCLWKGIITTVTGAAIWLCGAAGKTLVVASQGQDALLAAMPDPAAKFDLMEQYGPWVVLAGAIWTTWLGMKAKKDQYDRDKFEADRDARRRADEADKMSELRLMVQQGMVRMELIHAEAMAAQPPEKQLPAPATEEPKHD